MTSSTFLLKKRTDSNCNLTVHLDKLEINHTMKNQFSKIFLETVNRKYITNSGLQISIPKMINNIAYNQYDENIFEAQKKSKGGKIFLLVDCSGSMRMYRKTREFCYNLFLAVEELRNIDMEIITFSCKRHDEVSVLDFIKTPKECERIMEDENDCHDNTGLALKNIEKYIDNHHGKKAVFILTDGIPECERAGQYVPRGELVELTRKYITRLENRKAKFFAIFLGRRVDETLKLMFRGKYFITDDLESGINKLVLSINDFLRLL